MPDFVMPLEGLFATDPRATVSMQEKTGKDSQTPEAEFAWFMLDAVENPVPVSTISVAEKNTDKPVDASEKLQASDLTRDHNANLQEEGLSGPLPLPEKVTLPDNLRIHDPVSNPGQDFRIPSRIDSVQTETMQQKERPLLQMTIQRLSIDADLGPVEAVPARDTISQPLQASRGTETTETELVRTGLQMAQPQTVKLEVIAPERNQPQFVPAPKEISVIRPLDPSLNRPDAAVLIPLLQRPHLVKASVEMPVAAASGVVIASRQVVPVGHDIEFSAPLIPAQSDTLPNQPLGSDTFQIRSQKPLVQPHAVLPRPLASVSVVEVPPLLSPDVVPSWVDPVTSPPAAGPVLPAQSAPMIVISMPDVARQVAQQVAVLSKNSDQGSIEIALNPEELGRVRLSMVMSEGTIIVNVAAERSETMQMMRRHIDQLSQEFRDLGFGDVNFSFDQQQRPRSAPDYFVNDADPGVILTETTNYPALRKSLSSVGGLDLRV